MSFLLCRSIFATPSGRPATMLAGFSATPFSSRPARSEKSYSGRLLGLELLAKYGRLDCAYEQIILDFPEEFDEALLKKARENLARLPHKG
jgi:hypothetical protein